MIMVPNLKTALATGFIFLSLITTLNVVSTKGPVSPEKQKFLIYGSQQQIKMTILEITVNRVKLLNFLLEATN